MSELPRTAPDKAPQHDIADIDLDKPSAARCYDYYLGGSANLEVDRRFAEQVLRRAPSIRDSARHNRAFLRRAVLWLSRHGIDQFLDIGSGIPTVGNVHEIAQQHNPEARTVYVDYEPIAVRHARAILDEGDPKREHTDMLQADLRDHRRILESSITRDLIDFSRPVGLLIVATMHFIGPGDCPSALMQRYRNALAPGSYLVMSHLTHDGVPEHLMPEAVEVERLYAQTPTPGYSRTHAEFTRLFDGFELVEPGIVWAPQWHPDGEVHGDPATACTIVGMGRKTA